MLCDNHLKSGDSGDFSHMTWYDPSSWKLEKTTNVGRLKLLEMKKWVAGVRKIQRKAEAFWSSSSFTASCWRRRSMPSRSATLMFEARDSPDDRLGSFHFLYPPRPESDFVDLLCFEVFCPNTFYQKAERIYKGPHVERAMFGVFMLLSWCFDQGDDVSVASTLTYIWTLRVLWFKEFGSLSAFVCLRKAA